MTARRPIVRKGGRDEQLPPGDTIAGLPLGLRAYTQAGLALNLTLDAGYVLTAYTQTGAGLKIQVTLNG